MKKDRCTVSLTIFSSLATFSICFFLSVLSSPVLGTTITYLVGDEDGFGGAFPADNRSAEEAASTNGAQLTDFSETGFGTFAFAGIGDPVFVNGVLTPAPGQANSLFVTFDIDLFETIDSIIVSMFTLGIQDNPFTSATGGGDQLLFDGALVDGYFNGIDQDGFPIGTSGLVTNAISDSLFDNALDGEVVLKILLNSTVAFPDGSIIINIDNPNGEPAAFDFFKLEVSGTLATTATDVPAPPVLSLMLLGFIGTVLAARRRRR
jgi:hypothetical protein